MRTFLFLLLGKLFCVFTLLQRHVASEFFLTLWQKDKMVELDFWGDFLGRIALNLFEALFKNGSVSLMSDCLHDEFYPLFDSLS